jgi:hypothetical protein
MQEMCQEGDFDYFFIKNSTFVIPYYTKNYETMTKGGPGRPCRWPVPKFFPDPQNVSILLMSVIMVL